MDYLISLTADFVKNDSDLGEYVSDQVKNLHYVCLDDAYLVISELFNGLFYYKRSEFKSLKSAKSRLNIDYENISRNLY